MAVTLSLAMIVKDEEKLLGRVLRDASSVCDEMVVIDTGSADRSRAVAESEGATVHDIEWRDDFATARNASFAWCSCDWILWLDGDDVLPETAKTALAGLKGTLTDDVDVVISPYHYRIADDGNVLLQVSRERLIRRDSGLKWEGRIHEVVPIPEARTIFAPNLVIEHRPDPDRRALSFDRNLRILEKEMATGHPTTRTVFYYANELYDHQRYEEAKQHFSEFLARERHPTPDRYWAYLYLAECERVLGHEEALIEAALKTIAEDPRRAEGYVALGRLFFDRGQWAKAAPLFVAATACRPPQDGFVRGVDYRYGPWDYLSVCFDQLGRRHEALRAAERALPGNPEADRIKANMRWMIEQL